MTKDQLTYKYTNFSNRQLLEVYHNIHDYSEEAKEAMAVVIQDRGGVDAILRKEQSVIAEANETERIKQEVRRMATPTVGIDFLKKMITSEVFDGNHTNDIIQVAFEEVGKDLEDRKIKSRTIILGAIGSGLGGLVGGILWGLQLMWAGRVFIIFFLGLAMLSYGTIRLFTKQSYKNIAVIILTVLSVAIALIIGQIMLNAFGKQGGGVGVNIFAEIAAS